MNSFFSRFGRGCGRALGLGLLLAGPAAAQTPAWQWGAASQLVVPPDAQTGDVSVAVDAAGRGYLAGTFRNNVFNATSPPAQINFGPTRLVGNPAAIRNGFVAQATPAGQWAWAVAVRASGASGASGFTPEARVFDVATAPNGDVYVCGYAQGTQVQVGTLSAALSAALGPNGFNLYVARLTAAGQPLWVQTVIGGLPSNTNVRLAVNPLTGGAVVAHVFAGRLQFGTLPALVTPNSSQALFVAELNPAGQWVSAVQSNAAGVGGVDALTAGPQGQLALTLSYESGPLVLGSLNLPAPAPLAMASAVADLGPAPGRQWRWAASTGEAPVAGVAYRPDGGVWVSGYGRGGNAVGGTTLPGTDVVGYVGRLTAAGQWASVTTAVGNPGTTVGLGPMATDGAGNAVVAGFAAYTGPVGASTTTLTLGPNTLTATNGSPIFFAARLNPAGTWAYAVAHPVPAGPPSTGLIYRLADAALDPAGNLLTGGDFTGSLTVGPTVNSSTGSNNREAVLSRLGAAGAPLAARSAALAPALACFPNPAHGTATLRLPAPAETAATALLLDALGREVRRYAVPARATETTLDVTGLAPGLYLVRCGAAVGRLVVE